MGILASALAVASVPACATSVMYWRYLDHLHRENRALLAALERGVDAAAVMHIATVTTPRPPFTWRRAALPPKPAAAP